jgi:Zn finger protein HypA/HybF involved in hydrogenase expression
MSAVLHLFESEQDAAEERRRAQIERARAQSRCGCCGRFTRPEALAFTAVCLHCKDDPRPVIVHKVAQARRWWLAVRCNPN